MSEAVLLLGPTGSGKTPLGEHLERTGFLGRPCRHFDFGRRLREIDAGRLTVAGLSAADLEVVRRCLRTGALLEAGEFPVAEAMLRDFLATGPALVVLNGLPRHLSQARALDGLLRVTAVVVLACSREVVLARIAQDAGGDRCGRLDDAAEDVKRRLVAYRARTLPVVEHYRRQGARIATVTVRSDTTPEDLVEALRP